MKSQLLCAFVGKTQEFASCCWSLLWDKDLTHASPQISAGQPVLIGLAR